MQRAYHYLQAAAGDDYARANHMEWLQQGLTAAQDREKEQESEMHILEAEHDELKAAHMAREVEFKNWKDTQEKAKTLHNEERKTLKAKIALLETKVAEAQSTAASASEAVDPAAAPPPSLPRAPWREAVSGTYEAVPTTPPPLTPAQPLHPPPGVPPPPPAVGKSLTTCKVSVQQVGTKEEELRQHLKLLGATDVVHVSLWSTTGTWFIRCSTPQSVAGLIATALQKGYSSFQPADKDLEMDTPSIQGVKRPTLYVGRLGGGDTPEFMQQCLAKAGLNASEYQYHNGKMNDSGKWKDPFCFILFDNAKQEQVARLAFQFASRSARISIPHSRRHF